MLPGQGKGEKAKALTAVCKFNTELGICRKEATQFRVIRACFRKLRKFLSDGSDQDGLPLHAFVVGHRAMRIADSESVKVPQAVNARVGLPRSE